MFQEHVNGDSLNLLQMFLPGGLDLLLRGQRST